ncbi:type IV pilin protein [Microbacterium sp. NPDC056044]|uniref:type IV pilin protein n=1 Tax=Microbacterium sp. NPDC056044 TaxID=3345690 RepID=UPI0035DEE5EC
MRQTIKNYIEAEKARREELDEKGFSLIELIIVVVILGILVAIAIPIFGNIQDTAAKNANSAAAANGATAAAAAFAASDASVTPASAAASAGSGNIHTVLIQSATQSTKTTDVCVGAYTGSAPTSWTGITKSTPTTVAAVAGPGCP